MSSAFGFFVSKWRKFMGVKDKFKTTETRNTLVLDLDSTLIYSVPIREYWQRYCGIGREGLLLMCKDGKCRVVFKRPGLDEFLAKVGQMFHLAVYTASDNEYCNAVANWIDNGRGDLKERYSRRSCAIIDGHWTKDITLVRRDLSKVVILDDNKKAYRFFEQNAISIKPWLGDFNDSELGRVFDVLKRLQHCDDVRVVLATEHNGCMTS